MRILIADDHELQRDTLVFFLEAQDGIEAAIAGTASEVCTRIENDHPYDLILVNHKIPGMGGVAGLSRLIGMKDGQRVALMAGDVSRQIAEQALDSGAAGFIPKSLSAKSLINALRFMAMGERYAPLEFMTTSNDASNNPLAQKLTPRELQVLQGLTEGKSNKQIARDLTIQEPTVKLHVKTLYRKVGAENRTQAALIAREAGLY